MTGIICGTGSYVPPYSMDNNDIAKLVETSDEWIRERTGVVRRHIIEEETTVSMAAEAGRLALADAGVDAMDVDLILAQIEMNRQLIATELAAANNAYAQGVGILQGYGSYLDQTTRDTLQYYLDQLEDAIEAEDKSLLDACTPPVQQLNSQIINALNSGAYGIVQ